MSTDSPANEPEIIVTPAPGMTPEIASPPPLAEKRRFASAFFVGFLGGLLGGVALSLLLVVGVVASWPRIRDLVTQGLGPQYAALNDRVTALASRPAVQTPSAPTSSPDAALAALAGRIQALEARGTPDTQSLADLSGRVTQLGTQLDGLRTSMPSEDSITALSARADAAVKSAQNLAAQRQSEDALLLVLGQLRDAVNRGDPFAPELHAASAVAPDSEHAALAALGTSAATGVGRTEVLTDQFAAVADAAMAAFLATPTDSTLWQRIEKQAATLISIRRTDGTGADTASVLGRAEIRVKEHDLAGAVDELGHLTGAPAAAVADWRMRAAARVATDRALSQITADLAAKLAADAQPAK